MRKILSQRKLYTKGYSGWTKILKMPTFTILSTRLHYLIEDYLMDRTSEIKKTIYCFIDESGDPSFYAKKKKLLVGTEGFQPLLILGLTVIENKTEIRKAILDFQQSIKSDPLYSTLPCVLNPKGWYLHARADQLEIRAKFTEFLRERDGYKTFIVLGRKRLTTFHKRHNAVESEFYFDMVYHLLKDRLNDESCEYKIFLSARGASTQERLKTAIDKALERDNNRRKAPKTIAYSCNIVRSVDTPELSITDYLMWAIQRYILSGEKRFYLALQDKYNLIIDLYDFENYSLNGKGRSNYYNRKKPFDLSKASEFRTDGYL